jgi:hypothetical protein
MCFDIEAKTKHQITGSRIIRKRKTLVTTMYDVLEEDWTISS